MSTVFDNVADRLAAMHAEISQLRFFLGQAPMMDAPSQRDRVLASQAQFAYIHPITFAAVLFFMRYRTGSELSVTVFPGSPTKWVVTSLMPKGRVLYSPLQIPGIEKILAR